MRPRLRSFLAMALLIAPFHCLAAPGSALKMTVTDKGYLDAPGVSVMLYDDNYSPIFFDQKDAAMQIILHGHRIATNGSVRLLPTPEQWDIIPHLLGRQADKAHDRLTASASYPQYHFYYHVVVAAEPGGFRVSVNLNEPLPQTLIGRAGFNLEFLPSLYMDKAYAVDDRQFGVFPRSPEARMTVAPPRPGDPKSLWYVQQWHEAKGYTQPLPFAQGKSITLAVDDPLNRISVTSDTGPLLLYDGRNEAQNGWYVLRTLIPPGKTQGAVVWHVRPGYIPNWTRPPMIAHSQAGYAAGFPKVAVIELDRRFKAPASASVLRLAADGTYRKVFQGPLSAPKPWLRYDYAKFDFSAVKEPGLYAIEYAGLRTDVFPISQDVYTNTWQTSLDGFLAVQMDHVSVRDAYRLWHGIAHMTDALQAPPNTTHFDGYWMGPSTESPYKPGQHIPGLNVGGWFDAGDFDNDAFGQYGTIQNLALAYETFHPKWDELSVNEKTRSVEMHRPDGTPDAVQQVEHGVLQILAQIRAVGHPFTGIQSPGLRWYTFIGDGASQTGAYSNNPDPRWAWTMTSPRMEYAAAASLAAASRTLKGWNDPLSKECLQAAIKLWKDAEAHPSDEHLAGYLEGAGGYREFGLGSPQWTAAVELTIATHGAEPYKSRVQKMFPTTPQQIAFGGWSAVRVLPYLHADYRTRLKAAVRTFVPRMNDYMAATPFGVPPSLGAWGGSSQVAEFGVAMYFLHEAFPDLVGPEYTLRAANYLLGTHPDSSVSYISGIGTASKLQAYGNNRADHTYVPGGMVPGYVVIKPDFPECITNFGFLWFEDEYTVDAAATWVLEANAADAIVKEKATGSGPQT
ncbi:MAG TPA: glycoside hydrolase family 9 protein [Steroidobacteraceae bacterium]|nr:glycoside hydrolase family 9 protein [Steroidobacteraceae bacterium]